MNLSKWQFRALRKTRRSMYNHMLISVISVIFSANKNTEGKMVGWPEILKKENLTREEKKCICNRLMTTTRAHGTADTKHFTEEDFRRVWMRKIGGAGGRLRLLLEEAD